MEKENSEQKLSNSQHSIESLINQISKLRKENRELKDFIKKLFNGEYTDTELEKLKQKVSRW